MNKYLVFLIFSLSLSASAMPGKVTVTSGSLRVKRADGMKVNFYPGSYIADFSWESGKAFLSVDRNDIRTDATLVFPSGASIPENGSFQIDGFLTGQTFAVNGNIQTERAQTQAERGREGCTYYRREWVCYGYGHDRYCRWEDVAVSGVRDVEFYFLTKKVSLRLQFDSKNGGDAAFAGQETTRRKVYTYQGECW